MDYPVWISESLAGAQLIAIVAVLHVFISHFAIGMGLYVVLAEKIAIKSGNQDYKLFVKKSSGLILLISAILGALTGVGIWFTIALVSPVGTASLIHTFVWGWATEWIFFVLEIVAILVYYYTWGKVSDSTHQLWGWLYFIGGWMSLFIINGILTFQLTPGKFLEDHSFMSGFFNPTFWPSLIGRTGIALILAGVFATLILSFSKPEVKRYFGRFAGYFVIAGAVITFLGMYWWVYSIPEEVRSNFLGGNIILSSFFKNSVYLTVILIVLSIITMLVIPKYMNIAFALILMVIGQAALSYYEFTRERVRKPYVVYNILYSNGIFKSDVEKISSDSFLKHAKWAKVGYNFNDDIEKGLAIFNHQCRICHMPNNGFNAMKPKIEGMSADDLKGMLDTLNSNPLMPPFFGNDEEKGYLAKYLEKIAQGGK
jgi:cytochrome bd-type quinol oxidase subunit 1